MKVDRKQKRLQFVLLLAIVAFFIVTMAFLVMLITSKISLFVNIGIISIILLLIYAIVEFFFFRLSITDKSKKRKEEPHIRKSVAVFLSIFAFSVLVAEVYPPFAGNPVETVFLLLAFSYAVSEIVVYFLWSGDEKKEAYEQPVRLSVIMTLFMILLLIMLAILCYFQPVKVSPAVVADETRATTFITHPTRVIESATIEESGQKDDVPAAGTIVKDTVVLYEEESPAIEVKETEIVEELENLEEPDSCAEPFAIVEFTEPVVPSVPLAEVIKAEITDSSTYVFVDQNDDFWADFYIAGESELQLFDGIYYMGLYVNDTYFGEIETISSSGMITVNAFELYSYLQDVLTDEALSRLALTTKKYIDRTYLIENGVDCVIDTDAFKVKLVFNIEDMPVQIISISGSSSRAATRSFSGGVLLEPAKFVLLSDYRLSSYFDLAPIDNFPSSLSFYFSSYNRFRILGTEGTFSYSFDFSPTDFKFDFNSYRIYRDFREQMLRLSFGNVSTDLLSPKGTAVGISLEKSSSYADPNAKKKTNYEQVLVVEKESVVTVINEGNEIYHKTLPAGKYRLQDFILYSGANSIKIIVAPLDGSPSKEIDVDINYSYSLLDSGEIYYGLSATAGRNLVDSSSGHDPWKLRIPFFNGKSIEYDFSDFVLSGYIQAGLSQDLSLNTSFAFGNQSFSNGFFNPRLSFAMEMTHANILGTTKYNLNIDENYKDGIWSAPDIYARISHQVVLGFKMLNSMNFAFTYQSPADMRISNRHRLYLSSSFAGRIGFMSWSLGLNGGLYTDYPDRFSWGTSISTSFTLSRNLYLSFSGGLNGTAFDSISATGRISATLSFGNSRTSLNYGNNYANADFSIYGDKYSLTAGTSTSDITLFDEYDFDASASYSGDMFGFSLSLDAYERFSRIRGNASISTGTVFADGLFTISNYMPSNFILIKQDGGLRGNKLTVGSIGYANSDEIPLLFSTGLYTGISKDRNTSLSFNSYDDSSFSMGTTVDVNIAASGKYGYTLRMSADEKYSVSGIVVLPDSSLWINGSSPLYGVDPDFNLILTELYVFTDDEGRFIATDLDCGTYGFDVNFGDSWYLYTFTVSEDFDGSKIYVFDGGSFISSDKLPSVYMGAYSYSDGALIENDEFWNMLYPDAWGDL